MQYTQRNPLPLPPSGPTERPVVQTRFGQTQPIPYPFEDIPWRSKT